MADGRRLAVEAVTRVLRDGRSLDRALETEPSDHDGRERALARELAFGVFRWLPRLEALLSRLLKKPLKRRDVDVRAILLIGMYQLLFTRIPAHAAVAETVALTRSLDNAWAAGLVNAVLRRLDRERGPLLEAVCREAPARFAHPAWMIDAVRRAWPDDWRRVLDAGNVQGPMTLRVNRRKASRQAYLDVLGRAGIDAGATPHCPDGITLVRPVDIGRLPGFESGEVSVQDGAAQLAAPLLGLKPGMRVLDACAAPGGKTAHMLELQPDLAGLVAVDRDADRLPRLEHGLERLGLSAEVVEADATRVDDWWDGRPFDRILIDAPCSTTGVIRRHPDVKFHRRAGDVGKLAQTQKSLLLALWPLLARGGWVLYATCSVLPQENQQQLAKFVESRSDASLIPIESEWGRHTSPGRQILPGDDGMDGFYYALLAKR